MPVILQNALPVALVFGQWGADEARVVPPGGQRPYTWKLTDPSERRLTFALRADAPRSVPLELGGLQGGSKVLWAKLLLPSAAASLRAASGPSHEVHVCIRRVSRAQSTIMVLPPVLIMSHLPWDVEFEASLDDAAPPPCGTNGVLASRRFLHGLPMRAHFGETEPASGPTASAGSPGAGVLPPRALFGLLPAAGATAWVRLRRPGEDWGPPLPASASEAEPYATLAPLPMEASPGGRQSVMCTCQDLRASPKPACTAQAASACVVPCSSDAASLPNVLHLRPLFVFENRVPLPVLINVAPLGALGAGPQRTEVLQGAGDPRQVRTLELQVFPGVQHGQEHSRLRDPSTPGCVCRARGLLGARVGCTQPFQTGVE